LQSSHAKRKPARRRYASTATHSGESEGKPQALGQRWRISSLSPSPPDGEAIARGRLKPQRGCVADGGGFAPTDLPRATCRSLHFRLF